MIYRVLISSIGVGFLHICTLAAHPGEQHEIRQLDAQIESKGPQVDLLVKRGTLHRIAGFPDQAIADLKQALDMAPGHSDAMLQLGLALFESNDATESELILSRYLLKHRHVEAFRTRGMIRLKHHDHHRAAKDFASALELASSPELFLRLSEAQSASGDHDVAAETLRDGLKRCNGAVTVRLALIEAECRLQRFDHAIQLIDDVMSTTRINTRWLLRKADILAAAGRQTEADETLVLALKEANRMLKRRPTRNNQLLAIEVLFKADRKSEATEKLNEFLRNHPNSEAARKLAIDYK